MQGVCDRDAGVCVCESGFHGDACELLNCPGGEDAQCSNHGRCISLKDASHLYDGYKWTSTASYTTPWDADRVHGCDCDAGYFGYDCSQQLCTLGDDPTATAALSRVSE